MSGKKIIVNDLPKDDEDPAPADKSDGPCPTCGGRKWWLNPQAQALDWGCTTCDPLPEWSAGHLHIRVVTA